MYRFPHTVLTTFTIPLGFGTEPLSSKTCILNLDSDVSSYASHKTNLSLSNRHYPYIFSTRQTSMILGHIINTFVYIYKSRHTLLVRVYSTVLSYVFRLSVFYLYMFVSSPCLNVYILMCLCRTNYSYTPV